MVDQISKQTKYHAVIQRHPMFKFGIVQGIYQDLLTQNENKIEDLRKLIVQMDTMEMQSVKKDNVWVFFETDFQKGNLEKINFDLTFK